MNSLTFELATMFPPRCDEDIRRAQFCCYPHLDNKFLDGVYYPFHHVRFAGFNSCNYADCGLSGDNVREDVAPFTLFARSAQYEKAYEDVVLRTSSKNELLDFITHNFHRYAEFMRVIFRVPFPHGIIDFDGTADWIYRRKLHYGQIPMSKPLYHEALFQNGKYIEEREVKVVAALKGSGKKKYLYAKIDYIFIENEEQRFFERI